MIVHQSLAESALTGGPIAPAISEGDFKVEITFPGDDTVHRFRRPSDSPMDFAKFIRMVKRFQRDTEPLIDLLSHGDRELEETHRKSAVEAFLEEVLLERWGWAQLSVAERERARESLTEDFHRVLRMVRTSNAAVSLGWSIGHAPTVARRLVKPLSAAACAPPVALPRHPEGFALAA